MMLLPEDYFAVYGEKLAEIGEPKLAWWETEREFNRMYSNPARGKVVRRFINYESFTASYRRYRQGGGPGRIEVHILIV
jgi:hypothetical protein